MNTGQIRLGLASVSVKMDPLSWQGHIVENTLGGTDSQTNKKNHLSHQDGCKLPFKTHFPQWPLVLLGTTATGHLTVMLSTSDPNHNFLACFVVS